MVGPLLTELYRRSIVSRSRIRPGDPVYVLHGRVSWGEHSVLIGRAGVRFINLATRRQVSIGDECAVEVLPALPFTVLRVLEVNGRSVGDP